MSSLSVVPIPILPMGMINAFLVMSSEGNILVDTGLPNSEFKIAKVLSENGLQLSDIDLIVITHAHGDHAGSAFRLRELCNAPILAHEAGMPFFQGEKEMTYCPTGFFGRMFLKTGRPLRPYDRFTPDIVLKEEESFDLSEFGVSGLVTFSPGHTMGSLSVTLSTNEVLAGDLVSSGILLGGIAFRNRAKAPPFEEDGSLAANELLKLLDKGMSIFYLGHGGPLSSQSVARYCRKVLGIK